MNHRVPVSAATLLTVQTKTHGGFNSTNILERGDMKETMVNISI